MTPLEASEVPTSSQYWRKPWVVLPSSLRMSTWSRTREVFVALMSWTIWVLDGACPPFVPPGRAPFVTDVPDPEGSREPFRIQ